MSYLETAIGLDELVEQAKRDFNERFARAPSWVAAAPGRVNLIGEHTDYNDGYVLPMAIDRYTVVAADAADHGQARLSSVTMQSEADLSLNGAIDDEAPSWARYAAGVIGVYADEGMAPGGFDAVIDSTVPLGGGLSSSAAFEVSLALVVESVGGRTVDARRRALLCQQAEHRAGVPCGVMDQFSSALCSKDHLMLLDCRDLSVDLRPLDDPSVTVLITNSNVKHELTGGEYAERRAQCERASAELGVGSLRDATLDQIEASSLDEVHRRRARHVVSEISRTAEAAKLVAERLWSGAGELMYASHDSLRDDYEVSCSELDVLVEAARGVGESGGVIGSRMTGGGFGGCTVTLVRTDMAERAAARIADEYHDKIGLKPTQFVTRPAEGARLLS